MEYKIFEAALHNGATSINNAESDEKVNSKMKSILASAFKSSRKQSSKPMKGKRNEQTEKRRNPKGN